MSSNSGTIELEFDAPEYIFSTPAGHRLAHSTLRPQLPYDPHDAQLEGICKAVDGIDIMVLTPTGAVPESIRRLLLVVKSDPPLLVMVKGAATLFNCD